jgi:hypothetical protein
VGKDSDPDVERVRSERVVLSRPGEWCLVSLKRHLRVVVALVFALEFLLFRTYFATNIAPYYPRNYDQPATYASVYEAYFSIRDHGWIIESWFVRIGAESQCRRRR